MAIELKKSVFSKRGYNKSRQKLNKVDIVNWKKKPSLKVGTCVSFSKQNWGLKFGTVSQIFLRDHFKEAREELRYIGCFVLFFWNNRPGCRNFKRFPLTKEIQTARVKELRTFSLYGMMQESGLAEIIPLMCSSAIWGQYPVFSHPEFPQGSLSGWR